jgi:membrane protease YdiL (CAAX protease family)
LSAPAQAAIQPNKSFRIAEVSLVMAIASFPYLFRSVAMHLVGAGSQDDAGRDMGMAMAIGHDLLILLLISYVLSRTGRRFRDIGFNWRWSDPFMGAGLVILAYFAALVAQMMMATYSAATGQSMHYWSETKVLFGSAPGPMVFGYAVLNPFFEELTVRAYLMTEVFEITGKAWVAIAVSVGLQSIIHIYQGWTNVIALAAMFFVLAAFFAQKRRILPVIFAHLIQDIWAVLYHFYPPHPRP